MARSISRFGTTEPFELQVSRGYIRGHERLFKFGYNAAVGNSTETIWLQGGAYTWPAAAAVLEITSTDDTNDAPAGTGALTVTLEGLDANYEEISETVTMTGQTAANTTNNYLRLHRMYVATAGSTNTNQGVIYASTGDQTAGVPDVATTIRSTIGATNGQTLQAFYTVPAGKTAYLTSVHASSADATNATTITVKTREEGGAFRDQERFIVYQSAFHHVRQFPAPITEKTDIEISGVANASTTDVAATFELLIIDN